mgnify:CR=1 FL=1
MSTHATIAITDGTKCRAIYLHWDGYLAWAGAILHDYYGTKEKATQLIKLGSLSVLKELIAPNPGMAHTIDAPNELVTVAYHRDRNEPLEINELPDLSISGEKAFIQRLADISGALYVYLFDERKGQWLVGKTSDFMDSERTDCPDAKPYTWHPLSNWF